MDNTNNWTLTDSQTETIATIDGQLDKIREESTGSTMKAMAAIKKYAETFKGEVNAPVRIEMLAALATMNPELVDAPKATGTNLATALTARYMDESFDVDLTKKEKAAPEPKEPTEAETSLMSLNLSDKQTVVASLRKLGEDDLRAVTAAVHKALTVIFAMVSTKKHALPAAAQNMISFLIGASGGSLEPFEISDPLIAEQQKVSVRTVQRAREALVKWMTATGIGLVDIVQPKSQRTGASTRYTVHVLNLSTQIVHGMLHGSLRPDAIENIATLAGRLTSEDNKRLKELIPADTFAAAEKMANALAASVDSLPKPTIEVSAAAAGAQKTAQSQKFESLRTTASDIITNAETLGLDSVRDTVSTISSELQKGQESFEKDGTEFDFDAYTGQLTRAQELIIEASKGTEEKAQATRRQVAEQTASPTAAADAFVESLALDEQKEAHAEKAERQLTEDVYLLAAIARQNGTTIETFLRLQDVLNRAFGQGQYSAPTDPDADETAADDDTPAEDAAAA